MLGGWVGVMTNTTPPPDSPSVGGAPEVLAQAAGLVRGLDEVLWAARGAGEQMETVAAIEELKSQLDAVELEVVGELAATRAVHALGWASTGDFLTTVAGGHKGSGPATVRLAEALDRPVLGPVGEALADGWLSTVKAQVIERAVERLPQGEELRGRGVQVLLAEAKRLDATDLRKAGRRLVEVVDPDGEERRAERALAREERAAHHDRHLSITDDQVGGAHIRGRCSAEDAALIRATLLPFSRPRPTTTPPGDPGCDPATCDIAGCGHDGRDPRDHGVRTLDALVEACRRLQTADLPPQSHGASPRINLVMDLADLRRDTGFGATDTGEDLSPETVRRMACDAEVIPVVLDGPSEVLDVGRARRLATVAIWRALVVRDRHCRFPGCTRPPIMCHAHHVRHWLDGGPTSLDNLVLLCGHHHRLVHSGPWSIHCPHPGEFRFDPPHHTRRTSGPRPDRPRRDRPRRDRPRRDRPRPDRAPPD